MGISHIFTAFMFMWCSTNAQEQGIIVDGVVPDKAILDSTINIKKLRMKKTDKNTFKISANVEILEDVPESSTVAVQFYSGNLKGDWEDMKTGIPAQSFCDWMQGDKDFWPKIVDKSSLPAKCPLKKGMYRVDGATLNFNFVPPDMKPFCYRVVLTIADSNSTPIYGFNVYGKIVSTLEGGSAKCYDEL